MALLLTCPPPPKKPPKKQKRRVKEGGSERERATDKHQRKHCTERKATHHGLVKSGEYPKPAKQCKVKG